MKRDLWRWVAVAAAVVVGLWLFSKCQEGRWQSRTDKETARADTAESSARINRALADVASDRASQLMVERDSALGAATRAQREADRLRSLRRVIIPTPSQPDAAPTVSDTAKAAVVALTNCEEETVVLRAALDHNRDAVRLAGSVETELRGALALEKISVDSLMTSNVGLKRQLASADPPCRVLFWSCPSRTTVAIGSVVLATGITISLTR